MLGECRARRARGAQRRSYGFVKLLDLGRGRTPLIPFLRAMKVRLSSIFFGLPLYALRWAQQVQTGGGDALR